MALAPLARRSDEVEVSKKPRGLENYSLVVVFFCFNRIIGFSRCDGISNDQTIFFFPFVPRERTHGMKAVGSLPVKKEENRVTASCLSRQDCKFRACASKASANSGGMTVLILLTGRLRSALVRRASRRGYNKESSLWVSSRSLLWIISDARGKSDWNLTSFGIFQKVERAERKKFGSRLSRVISPNACDSRKGNFASQSSVIYY